MSNAPSQTQPTTWAVSDLFAVNTFTDLTEAAARTLAQAEANKTGFQHLVVDLTTGAFTRFEPMPEAA